MRLFERARDLRAANKSRPSITSGLSQGNHSDEGLRDVQNLSEARNAWRAQPAELAEKSIASRKSPISSASSEGRRT
jgi:hypothetical protein